MNAAETQRSIPTGGKGWVVSDLHLFADRSEGDALFQSALGHALEEGMELLILNGDTFDFRWSTLSSEQDGINAAIAWLERLMERTQGVRIRFLLGNHDCLAAFVDRLKSWAPGNGDFAWSEHRLQVGTSLFLHGDAANRRMDGNALQRFRDTWAHDHPKGDLARRLYAATDRTGLSRAFHSAYFPPRVTVKRLAFHLDAVLPGWRSEVTDVYFGHTHCPLANQIHDGIRFHNTGSGIRGMGFAPRFFAMG